METNEPEETPAPTPKRYRGQRGPNKVSRPKMRLLSLRLPEHVFDFYNGSSSAMRTVLTAWAEGRLQGSVETIPTDDKDYEKWVSS